MWTKTAPTEVGWYWHRWQKGRTPEIAEVFKDGQVLSVAWIAYSYARPTIDVKCEWWPIPIQQPTEPNNSEIPESSND